MSDGIVWLVPWISRCPQDTCTYTSNNHLTGGSAGHTAYSTLLRREAVVPNWGFGGNLGLTMVSDGVQQRCRVRVQSRGKGWRYRVKVDGESLSDSDSCVDLLLDLQQL